MFKYPYPYPYPHLNLHLNPRVYLYPWWSLTPNELKNTEKSHVALISPIHLSLFSFFLSWVVTTYYGYSNTVLRLLKYHQEGTHLYCPIIHSFSFSPLYTVSHAPHVVEPTPFTCTLLIAIILPTLLLDMNNPKDHDRLWHTIISPDWNMLYIITEHSRFTHFFSWPPCCFLFIYQLANVTDSNS